MCLVGMNPPPVGLATQMRRDHDAMRAASKRALAIIEAADDSDSLVVSAVVAATRREDE